MSGVNAIGAPDVRTSIARASQATGVDFDYLLAQAKLESDLDPNARASTSSATGLFQFIGSTWLETLDRHGAKHGLSWADAAITKGAGGARIANSSLQSQIMDLRYDPDTSSLMAAELALDNREALRTTLGRDPDHAELYLAHFLGTKGANRFLDAMQRNPDSSAAALFPTQAAANRPVFFEQSGSARSLGQVMDLFRSRLSDAMNEPAGALAGARVPGAQAARHGQGPQMSPIEREFHETAMSLPAHGRTSIVDTLRDTFASAGDRSGALPANVKSAYAKFKAFKL